MKELSIEETKIVSGGHEPTVREMHGIKGKNPHGDGVPGKGKGLDNHTISFTTIHGGWGKGGKNG